MYTTHAHLRFGESLEGTAPRPVRAMIACWPRWKKDCLRVAMGTLSGRPEKNRVRYFLARTRTRLFTSGTGFRVPWCTDALEIRI